MNKPLLLFSAFVLLYSSSIAQTGISAAGTAPDASAMLDVIATDKGFLAPRVALLANNNSTLPIASPAAGLLVYNTATAGSSPNNVTPGYYYWDGTVSLWQKISAGNSLGFIQNQNSADQTASWRITGSGQWGGATSKGSLSIDQGSSIELGGTGSPYIDIANATADDFDVRLQLTGDDYLLISGANVGIGSASPTEKLDVAGGVNSHNAGFGQTSGTAGVKNFANFSSDNHGSLLVGSNLYSNSGVLTVSKTHATLSGVGIFMPGNGQTRQGGIDFYTKATAAVTADAAYGTSPTMVLTSAGNMGIGTTAAAAFKLQVAGDVGPTADITYNLGSPALRWNNLYVNAILGPGALWTASGTHIYNSNSGNVGIGVASPTGSKLQVAGFVSGSDGTSFATKWSGDNHHGIWYRASVSADGATVSAADAITYREYGSASLGHHFWTGGTTQTERFRITNNYAAFLTGNVGIATATTNNRMEFMSDNSAQAMQWNTSTYVGADQWGTRIYKSDIGGGIPLKFQTQSASTWYDGIDLDHGQDNAHPSLKSYYNTQLATAGGNVGIGNTSPLGKLDIRVAGGGGAGKIYTGGDNSFPRIYMGGTSTTVAFVINRETASATQYFGEDADAGGFQFRGTGGTRISSLGGTGTRVVVADASGNLSATTSIGTGIVSGNGTLNYIPKWTTTGSTLGNSLITDDATTITAGGQFDVTGGTGTGYGSAPIEIRTTLTPRLAFHWPGVVASQIAMESSGRIAIRDNPGTGYENFIARDVTITGVVPGVQGYYPPNNAIRMTPNFHFNTPAGYAMIVNWDNGAVGGGTQQFRVGNGTGTDQFYVRADGQFFGRYFADLDDAGYNLDPNSTSNSALRIRGGALHGPNPSWGAYLLVGGDGRNGYIDNGNTASVSATDGNLHLDASSGHGLYLNYYDGDPIHFGRGNNSIRATMDGNGLYLYDGWFRAHGSNGFYFQDYGTGIQALQPRGGQYGSVSTYGNVGGWEGYSVGGRYVFMADNAQNMGLYNDVDNYWYMLINRLSTNDGYIFYNSYDGHYNMRIQHTNGHNYASYDGDNNWDFYSDRRLKEHIEHEANILDRLMKLDVVNYDFIELELTEAEKAKGIVHENRKDKEIGFIAQDVEPYFPSLVSETADPRYDFKVKALGYSSFGILAVGGIKELKIEKDAEIAGLNKKVAELKEEVEKLKSFNTTSSENAQLKSEIAELKKMMLELEKKVNTK